MVGGFFLPLRLSLPSAYGINPSGAIAASPSDETVIKGTRDSRRLGSPSPDRKIFIGEV